MGMTTIKIEKLLDKTAKNVSPQAGKPNKSRGLICCFRSSFIIT